MALFCKLCFKKSNEYFTTSSDFRDKIIKHLDVQVS